MWLLVAFNFYLFETNESHPVNILRLYKAQAKRDDLWLWSWYHCNVNPLPVFLGMAMTHLEWNMTDGHVKLPCITESHFDSPLNIIEPSCLTSTVENHPTGYLETSISFKLWLGYVGVVAKDLNNGKSTR